MGWSSFVKLDSIIVTLLSRERENLQLVHLCGSDLNKQVERRLEEVRSELK